MLFARNLVPGERFTREEARQRLACLTKDNWSSDQRFGDLKVALSSASKGARGIGSSSEAPRVLTYLNLGEERRRFGRSNEAPADLIACH